MFSSGFVDSITFEGRGNAKLLSLETLGEQERRYLEILVNKVLALSPDVLFVAGSVSSTVRAYDTALSCG